MAYSWTSKSSIRGGIGRGMNQYSSSRPDGIKCTSDTYKHGDASSEESLESQCVCSRPKSRIICRSCGHTFIGRVRQYCTAHPGTILLMDVEACPICKSLHLKEVCELLLGVEKVSRRDS